MISFWAQIEESDIEGFAGTVVLPSYMSYLKLSPFRFANQSRNYDGRTPLILTYTGEGRVEEMSLSPEKYASELLSYVLPGLSGESVRIGKEGTIWMWNAPPSQNGEQSPDFERFGLEISSASYPNSTSVESGSHMKIFFETRDQILPENVPAREFSPFQTYVSVSRRELFVGIQILSAYLRNWVRKLTDPEFPAHPESPSGTGESGVHSLRPSVNGISFTSGKIGGEFILDNDAVFQDLLEFAGLSEPLSEVSQTLVPHLNSPETQIGEIGILLKLAPFREKSARKFGARFP